jgi:hypothetical protein
MEVEGSDLVDISEKGDLVCEDPNYNVMFKVYIYIL